MWRLKVADDGPPEWRGWLTSVNNHVGRQRWEFDPDAGTPEERAEIERLRDEFTKNRFIRKQSSDHLMRLQMRKENDVLRRDHHQPTSPRPAEKMERVQRYIEVTKETLKMTLERAISYFATIQAHDGHWPSELAGSLFFQPPFVIALYITGDINTVLSLEHQKEIKRYIYNHQNENGGWGLHIEGPSTMFCSVLNYVALRLLEDGSNPRDQSYGDVERGRKWILDHGGAVGTPSWGKFWLAVLGAYEWDGCNPIPPELWLLPKFLPVHPGQLSGLCRLMYMPMSYLYGKRFVGPVTQLVCDLRKELYTQPYHNVDWNKAKNMCAKADLYYPHPLVQDLLSGFLSYIGESVLNRWPFYKLREKAMIVAMQHVHYEDEVSRYISIGVSQKVANLLACWVEDPNSKAYKCHLARLPDYYWLAEDGLKFQINGSQTWDAAFAIQAIISSKLCYKYKHTLRKAHNFLKASQVRENHKGDYKEMYRTMSKGSWTFSTPDHGWQVSDCTAEALKATLLLSEMHEELVGKKLEYERVYDAVNIILSLQSKNGGMTAWEPQRGYRWFEKFNPSEFLEDIMVEKEVVEVTSSAINCLSHFKKLHPGHRREEIEKCILKATQYILDMQNQDGSWTGFWGICYTYGTWLAVEGLVATGNTYNNCPALQKACNFLLSKQLADGGWGESYLSSHNKVYTNTIGNKSNLVQTSWALLALIKAGQANIYLNPIQRGVRLLINSQERDGDFPQQDPVGAFMNSCVLNYAAYRNIFPIWALGEYRQQVMLA